MIIDDELRIAALVEFLQDGDVADKIESVGRDNTFSYGDAKYRVLTDDEADAAFEERLLEILDEHVKTEVPEYLQFYIDKGRWVADRKMDDRGQEFALYDAEEHGQEIEGVYFYIYRTD